MKLHPDQLQNVDQVRAFLAGTQQLEFEFLSAADRYQWCEQSLRLLRYQWLKKGDKGVVKIYLAKVTGLSRAQITRLIKQFVDTGRIKDRRGRPSNAFARRYGPQDIALLAEVDALHGTLSGLATQKLCERGYYVFGDQRFERLARISHGHLYNLRHSSAYQRRRRQVETTRRSSVNIGERRRPQPEGRPGFLRVDTVHQGDRDGIKGLYHINAVDEVSQMQFVVSVARISERYLLPALEQLLAAFPFVILGFHADNGSEYINHQVAKLLEKLRIELTKSRARQSNDNALVESKNGSVVRKHLGYEHIPTGFAAKVNDWNLQVLSPYLNYHRPCLFPEEVTDERGRRRKRYRYRDLMTPYEKLKSLPKAEQSLKPGITFEHLDQIAMHHSDSEAARILNETRQELFRQIQQHPAA